MLSDPLVRFCALSLSMPTVARFFSGSLLGSNTLLPAPELPGCLEVLFSTEQKAHRLGSLGVQRNC